MPQTHLSEKIINFFKKVINEAELFLFLDLSEFC